MGDANGISAEIIAKTLGKKKNLSFLPIVLEIYLFFKNFLKILKKLPFLKNR